MSVYHLKRVIAVGLCNGLSQKYIDMTVFTAVTLWDRVTECIANLILWKDGTWKIKEYQCKI